MVYQAILGSIIAVIYPPHHDILWQRNSVEKRSREFRNLNPKRFYSVAVFCGRCWKGSSFTCLASSRALYKMPWNASSELESLMLLPTIYKFCRESSSQHCGIWFQWVTVFVMNQLIACNCCFFSRTSWTSRSSLRLCCLLICLCTSSRTCSLFLRRCLAALLLILLFSTYICLQFIADVYTHGTRAHIRLSFLSTEPIKNAGLMLVSHKVLLTKVHAAIFYRVLVQVFLLMQILLLRIFRTVATRWTALLLIKFWKISPH